MKVNAARSEENIQTDKTQKNKAFDGNKQQFNLENRFAAEQNLPKNTFQEVLEKTHGKESFIKESGKTEKKPEENFCL